LVTCFTNACDGSELHSVYTSAPVPDTVKHCDVVTDVSVTKLPPGHRVGGEGGGGDGGDGGFGGGEGGGGLGGGEGGGGFGGGDGGLGLGGGCGGEGLGGGGLGGGLGGGGGKGKHTGTHVCSRLEFEHGCSVNTSPCTAPAVIHEPFITR